MMHCMHACTASGRQSARLLLQLLLRLLLADARLAVSAHSHRQQQLLC